MPRRSSQAPGSLARIAAVALLPSALACAQAAAPPAPTELAPAWFQLDERADVAGDLIGHTLRVGVVGATEHALALPREASAAGPYGAHVVVVQDDGIGSTVEAIDARSGVRRVLVRSSVVLRRAAVDPQRRALLVTAVDRESRAQLGVWRFPWTPDEGVGPACLEDGVLLLPPLVDEPDDEAFGRTFSTEFVFDADGDTLAVQSCGEMLCRARVLDVAIALATHTPGGAPHVLRDEIGQGELVGIVDGELLAYFAGNGWPAPILQIDIETGAARELPIAYGAALSGETLVYESGDRPGEVRARAVGSGDERILLVLDAVDELRLVPRATRALGGVALPTGLLPLSVEGRVAAPDGGQASPYFLRVADGALFTAR